jgi:hypothetical protein
VAAAYERAYEDVVTHSLTSLVKGG